MSGQGVGHAGGRRTHRGSAAVVQAGVSTGVLAAHLGVQTAAQAGIWNTPACLWVWTTCRAWSPGHTHVNSTSEPVVLVLTHVGMRVPAWSQRVCTATCPSAKVLGAPSRPLPSAHMLHDLAMAVGVIVMLSPQLSAARGRAESGSGAAGRAAGVHE